MKKILTLLILLLSAQLFSSCADSSDKDGEEQLTPVVTIASELVAGMPADITVSAYNQAYTLLFNDTPMEVKIGDNGPYIDIPTDMQGPYEVYVVIETVKHKVYSTAVFKFAADCFPGVAYKADLSNANTLYSISDTKTESTDSFACQTFKFGNGAKPAVLQFSNSQGRAVPAGFVSMKDMSPDFFYATMWNISELKDLTFDIATYTCNVSRNIMQTPVVVEKKSGIITRLLPKDNAVFLGSTVSLQWMGGRTFCALPDTYGNEFSAMKPVKFTIPEFVPAGGEKAMDERFSYETKTELLGGLETTDILNGIPLHWVAASEGNVFLNREKMLHGGSLSSIDITSLNMRLNHPVFCSYFNGGIYFIKKHADSGQSPWVQLCPLINGDKWINVGNCSCDHLVYQYADYTFLKAQATAVGEKIHDITIDKTNVVSKEFTATIADEGTISEIWEDAITRFPCYSAYEYYISADSKQLLRRKIATHDAAETIYTNTDDGSFTKVSAAANGLSFSRMVGQQHKVYEANGSGAIVQEVSLDANLALMGICRIKD